MASATTTFTSTSFNSLSSTTFNRPRHSPASYVTFRRPTPSISAVYATATATANETTSVGVASSSVKTTSLYEVLGIQAGATGKEIKAAYRKLARVLHPDVVACAVAKSKDATSADDFIRVHEAYATLSDPKKRADYDRMMWLQGRRLSYSPTYCTTSGTTKYGGGTTSCSGFSGYTRRTWETDQCW